MARLAWYGVIAACVSLCLSVPGLTLEPREEETPTVQVKDPKIGPATMTKEDAKASIDRSIGYLLRTQLPDGSFGTSTVESLWEEGYSNASFYAWKMAGCALVCSALLAVEETTEVREGLEKSLSWLLENPLPLRGSDWDIDNNWTRLYYIQTMVQAADDPRFQSPEWKDRITRRGIECYEQLEKNQDPLGGWGYYEGIVVSRRPTWSTSFATACVMPSLVRAKELGWPVDAKLIARATKYVERCRLPNGAFTYGLDPIPRINGGEHINQVKGSLSRIQVCNWALRRAGSKMATEERMREGVDVFFREHKFLDVARMKPIPHESYYANAGYFYFFGHYYAARVIEELPAQEREALHARLRPHLIKAQWKDGSSIDFVGSTYSWLYSTSFSVLALQAGLKHSEE